LSVKEKVIVLMHDMFPIYIDFSLHELDACALQCAPQATVAP
jgi:hypothetical protein